MDYRIIVFDQDGELHEIVDTTDKDVFDLWVQKRRKQGFTCRLLQKEAGTIEFAAI